jgi:hypothetical protein
MHIISWRLNVIGLTIRAKIPTLSLSLSLWLYSPLGLGRFFTFSILYTVGRTSWTGDQPITRPLPTHRTTPSQNKPTQTSMPRVGLEPTTLVFERAKAVHALDRATDMIGRIPIQENKQTNSVALVRKRTIPTERPPHVGEVSANFCVYRVSRGQRNGSPRPCSQFSRPEPLLFLPSSSSIVFTTQFVNISYVPPPPVHIPVGWDIVLCCFIISRPCRMDSCLTWIISVLFCFCLS